MVRDEAAIAEAGHRVKIASPTDHTWLYFLDRLVVIWLLAGVACPFAFIFTTVSRRTNILSREASCDASFILTKLRTIRIVTFLAGDTAPGYIYPHCYTFRTQSWYPFAIFLTSIMNL